MVLKRKGNEKIPHEIQQEDCLLEVSKIEGIWDNPEVIKKLILATLDD